jgi:hypothetical protein
VVAVNVVLVTRDRLSNISKKGTETEQPHEGDSLSCEPLSQILRHLFGGTHIYNLVFNNALREEVFFGPSAQDIPSFILRSEPIIEN